MDAPVRGPVRIAAAILCGAVAGASLAWPAAAWRVQQLILENDALLLRLDDAQNRLSRLEETVAEIRAPVVQELAIVTDVKEPDERVALERAIRPAANEFIGRPVEDIDEALLRAAFDGRLLSVNGRVYRLTLAFAFIAPKSRLVFRARLVPPAPPG
ncbi:MAG: hypothetical protein IMW98_03130 [Firmicutes bacterium]|nr:hypothetical protein [Bacillota bacterium]